MKLELNVKRFNNEDVIATSGLCEHSSDVHYYIKTYNTNPGAEETFDMYLLYDGDYFNLSIENSSDDFTGVDSTGWWYADSAGILHKCADQSSDAHPTE